MRLLIKIKGLSGLLDRGIPDRREAKSPGRPKRNKTEEEEKKKEVIPNFLWRLTWVIRFQDFVLLPQGQYLASHVLVFSPQDFVLLPQGQYLASHAVLVFSPLLFKQDNLSFGIIRFCEYICNIEDGEVFKDIANIFYKLFTFLVALVALKLTEVGKKLFAQQRYTAWVLAAVMVFFLLWVFHTLLRHRFTRFFPILLLLLLGCAVSFSALRIISPNVAIFNLALWGIVLVAVPIVNNNNNYYGTQNVAVQLEQTTGVGVGVDSDKRLEVLKDAFSAYDTDGNGSITAEELNAGMRRVGQPCSLAECRRLVAGVDGDDDGWIDFKEFRVMIDGISLG